MLRMQITKEQVNEINWDGILLDANVRGFGFFFLKKDENGSSLPQMYRLLKCDLVDCVEVLSFEHEGKPYSIDLWVDDNPPEDWSENGNGFLIGESARNNDGFYVGSGILLAANLETGATVPIPEEMREKVLQFAQTKIKFWGIKAG